MFAGVGWSRYRRFLQNLHVLGLESLWALGDVELHRLAFLQAAKTVRLDCRMMYENVLAVLAADEPVTLGIVKPLHCSLFHFSFFLCVFLLRRPVATEG